MLIVCSKFTVFKDDIIEHIEQPPIYMHDCGFHKSRDLESFIILNFVVLYSSLFKLYFMSLPCSLNTWLSIVYI
jgi:hypothetical protein